MEVLKQLLGRLHPLIVHLPIGFIIFGLLLQCYDRKRKENDNVISLVYLWAGISAVLACITGYLQYLGEGFTYDTVKWHLWSGLITALFSFLMYAKLRGAKVFDFLSKVPILVLSLVFFVLISFTGHQGGSITHGEGYLVEPLPNHIKSALGFESFEEKQIILNDGDWQDALLYEDVVKPIMNNKCFSCHGPKKSKGELKLHTKEAILKGGENGDVIAIDNPNESELFRRLLLPKTDEDHMPPKDKTQPSKAEIKIIETWISHGNPFDKSIGELGLDKGLFQSFFPKKHDDDFPDIEISAAPKDSIASIGKNGIHIDKISKSTNFLAVSCINKPTFTDNDFELLAPITEQIAVLDLGGTSITDSIVEKLVTLPHLTILKLDNTSITGAQFEALAPLPHLKSINLSGSKFEKRYVKVLSNFKNLRKVYLFKSRVEGIGIQTLNDGQLVIDYGNYELPTIAADSIVY